MGVKSRAGRTLLYLRGGGLAALWVGLWGRVSAGAVLVARRERMVAGTRVPVEKV